MSQQTLCKNQVSSKSVRVRYFLCWFDMEWPILQIQVGSKYLWAYLKSKPILRWPCVLLPLSLPIMMLFMYLSCSRYHWRQHPLWARMHCMLTRLLTCRAAHNCGPLRYTHRIATICNWITSCVEVCLWMGYVHDHHTGIPTAFFECW